MARPREYDRQEVISKATHLFWKKGFEATSMSELIAATGLNSASLYKEFGNKEGLYETALENYRQRRLEPFLQPLVREPNWAGITEFLEGCRKTAENPDFMGCLMMNTLVEKNVVGLGAFLRVEKFCVRLETVLENAIRGAQREGVIPAQRNPATLAHYLACMVHGLVLYGRVEEHQSHVGDIIETIQGTLRG